MWWVIFFELFLLVGLTVATAMRRVTSTMTSWVGVFAVAAALYINGARGCLSQTPASAPAAAAATPAAAAAICMWSSSLRRHPLKIHTPLHPPHPIVTPSWPTIHSSNAVFSVRSNLDTDLDVLPQATCTMCSPGTGCPPPTLWTVAGAHAACKRPASTGAGQAQHNCVHACLLCASSRAEKLPVCTQVRLCWLADGCHRQPGHLLGGGPRAQVPGGSEVYDDMIGCSPVAARLSSR
jgi:hypothetical protein